MSQDETCEIVQILKEAKTNADWGLVEEALIYLTNYCDEYEQEDEE